MSTVTATKRHRFDPVVVGPDNVSAAMRRTVRDLELLGFRCRFERRGPKEAYAVLEYPGVGVLIYQASELELTAFLLGLNTGSGGLPQRR